MQQYPATLLLYGLGLGAVASSRLKLLSAIFATVFHSEHQEDKRAIQVLPPVALFPRVPDAMKLLEGMNRHYLPLNDWLHGTLQPYTKNVIPSSHQYTLIFDKLEILIALGGAEANELSSGYWAPPGLYGFRHQNTKKIFGEIETSLQTEKNESPYVLSGVFGNSPEECAEKIEALRQFIPKWNRSWF